MNGLELPADNVVSLLANEGRDYCLTHGLVMGSKDSFFGVEHAPFTLLPTAFLERLFTKAKDVQKDFNVLVHRVSQDHEFLKTALQRCVYFVRALEPYITHMEMSHSPINAWDFSNSCVVWNFPDFANIGRVLILSVFAVRFYLYFYISGANFSCI